MPESAHWLWFKGRRDEARQVAYKYMLDGKQDVEELERLDVEKQEQQVKLPAVRFRDIFGPTLWRTTAFFTIFWIANTLPFFGIGTFAERVVAQYGLSGGIAGGVGINTIALIGVTFAMLTVDRIGRRPLATLPMWIILAVFLTIIFWSGAPSIVILLLFFVFAFMNAVGGALNVVYPAEIFPAEVRGLSIGFATALSRIAAATGTFLMPVGIERWGMTPVMLALSVVVFIGAVATQLWAPETKGQSLAQLADAKR